MPADRLRDVRRQLWLSALAGAVVGSLVGLFLPIRAAQPPEPDAVAWSLPNAQALKRFNEEEFRRLRTARFWGELARPGERTRQPQASWRLLAIVTRPDVQVAVSEGAKAGQTWVRLGGTLPDGSSLVQVTRDGVVFEKEGCRRRRALYRASPTEPDVAVSGCIGADGGAAPPPTGSRPATPTARRGA